MLTFPKQFNKQVKKLGTMVNILNTLLNLKLQVYLPSAVPEYGFSF